MSNVKSDDFNFLHANRCTIRNMVQSCVVKSMKIYTANDGNVCQNCLPLNGKIFKLTTPEEINIAMQCDWVKKCKNEFCRCYIRPEEISAN